MQRCPLPLVRLNVSGSEEAVVCGSSLFEENEPFTTYLQAGSLCFQVLVLLFVLVTILGFFKRDKGKRKKQPVGVQESFFFKQKVLFLTFGGLGIFSLILHIYGGFLLKQDIRETKGKINAGLLLFSCNLMFLAQYTLFPMLARLLGITSRKKHVSAFVLVGKVACVLATLVGGILLFLDDITLERFCTYLFTWILFLLPLLLTLMNQTIDQVIKNTANLLSARQAQRFGVQNTQSLISFIFKLRIFKMVNYMSMVTVCGVSLALAMPRVSGRENALLFQACFANTLGINSIPLFVIFSQYTNKGIDRCWKENSFMTTPDSASKRPAAIESINISKSLKMNKISLTTSINDSTLIFRPTTP